MQKDRLSTLNQLKVIMLCGAFNEVPPQSLRHLKTWSPIGGCLGRVRRYGLAERGVSLG